MGRIDYDASYGSPDPRDYPAEEEPRGFGGRRRPRGPKTFGRVTYPAVARAAGVKPDAVKKAAVEGRIDMRDLVSVSLFIAARLARAERRRTTADKKKAIARARAAKASTR